MVNTSFLFHKHSLLNARVIPFGVRFRGTGEQRGYRYHNEKEQHDNRGVSELFH